MTDRLVFDLGNRVGPGFSRQSLQQMRLFCLAGLPGHISQTASAKLPLSSAFFRHTRESLPSKVLTAEYRTALSDEKLLGPELEKGGYLLLGNALTPDEAIRDPYVLEFLSLRAKHTAIRQANAALLPAMLERVFQKA